MYARTAEVQMQCGWVWLGMRARTVEEPRCKECGGSGLCPHGRVKWWCKECGGTAGICTHGRRKYYCKECGGAGVCLHGRQKHSCKECGTLRKPAAAVHEASGQSQERWCRPCQHAGQRRPPCQGLRPEKKMRPVESASASATGQLCGWCLGSRGPVRAGSRYCSDACGIEWVKWSIEETKNGKKPAQHIASAVAVNSQRERSTDQQGADQQGTEFRSGIPLTNVPRMYVALRTRELVETRQG